MQSYHDSHITYKKEIERLAKGAGLKPEQTTIDYGAPPQVKVKPKTDQETGDTFRGTVDVP
jgi:hypothetical protein